MVRAERIINDVRGTIKLFKALGSHPKKLFYVEDIEVLVFVYGSILKKMRRPSTGLGREFWRELVKFIHSRTLVDGFEKVAKAEISGETLDKLLETTVPTVELRRVVADYYFYLRGILLRTRTTRYIGR